MFLRVFADDSLWLLSVRIRIPPLFHAYNSIFNINIFLNKDKLSSYKGIVNSNMPYVAFIFPRFPKQWKPEGNRMKNATELFGARLRELRKGRGLTQEQLAEVLGIEQKHVSLMEHGKSYPSLDRLMRIAEALKVPLPSLFEFMYLENEVEQARSIEQMLRELDEDSRKKAFKIITSVIKSFKEV